MRMDDRVQTFQRIQVLLQEYTTLRAEVLSRYTAQFQAGGIAAIILLSIITLAATTKIYAFLILIVLDLGLFVVVILWIDVDIAKAARRLRRLEKQINFKAREELLKWESVYGLGGIVGKYILRWQE